MTSALTEAQARVLSALQGGAALTMHSRSERGPFYMLSGRRLSMTLVKDLERLRYISRSAGMGRSAVAYELTSDGQAALMRWEAQGPAADL
ncbi:hypothetical protein GCM10008955_05790 [Deinococcus malanensis]|uniref:ArsR family transcriptional regulator n=1 Tax=Deinococcus malanensis TaxID=1706855 RepID=A0ABQ2EK89_9DEIO|nr:hypothetical protein [Deinococcus malanensis]GGK15239.1 hypothetical protein GCM10008955_05790 [Deinococcus malanensis]